MSPSSAITVLPATGEAVNYWTKLRSVTLEFSQTDSATINYSAPFTPRTAQTTVVTTFTGAARNVIGDTSDGEGPTQGSFGITGGCYLGPMMTGTPFNFLCRGNGSVVGTGTEFDSDYTRPTTALGGSFTRNLFTSPTETGIPAPWYITVAGIANRIGTTTQEQLISDQYLVIPWSDFDQGGSFSHSWGWTATVAGGGIVTAQTASGSFTINLIT